MSDPKPTTEYVIIEPECAYAHLPRKLRREALRHRARAIQKANKLVRSGRAHVVNVNEIPEDAIVHGGPR